MRLAAIYVRVSSDKQTENQSIDAQLSDSRKLADREGFAVYREYADGGFSGMTNDRPGLQELLADAEARAFDAIIVWDQSRFGRDFVDVELNLKRLEELGIEFRAVYGPTGDDDTVKLTRRILAAVYEKEQQDRKRRQRAGRRMKAESGRGWFGGAHPYGYTTESFAGADGKTNTKLIPHPEQAPIVKLIFDLLTKEAYAPYSLAKYLNAQGIKSKFGKAWHTRTVRYIAGNTCLLYTSPSPRDRS